MDQHVLGHLLVLRPGHLLGFLPEHLIELFYCWTLQGAVLIFTCIRAYAIQVEAPDLTGHHFIPIFFGRHQDSLFVVVPVHAQDFDEDCIVIELCCGLGYITVDESFD